MQSTSPSLTSDREFIPWLQQQNISLGFTTYQTNWLAFLGVNPETGGISAFQRQFNRAMGLYCTPDRLYLSSKYQLWQLDNVLQPGQFYQGGDRLFIPRISYTTGDIDVHDVAVTETGELIFISTLLNCLATTSDRHSCKPLWKPPFISQIINEDRCHLNGLAMVDGQPGYVTACSRSDVVDGWRDRRKDGGVAIDIASNEIVVTGLSMPHSPRFYQGKLWLLNSGKGEFGYVDLELGKFESITFCPGYARGLAFWGDYAIVGLSKPRSGDGTFSGLLLDDRLKEKDADARCGLLVIDLKTGTIVHWARIEGTITELYDVGVLPGTQNPMALGFQTQEIEQLITLESLSEINLVIGNKKGGDKTGDRTAEVSQGAIAPTSASSGDKTVQIPPTPLKKGGYETPDLAESFPTLNVLLFFQRPRDYYRPILFSHNEVFCSPDCQTTIEGDRLRTVKTPVGEFDAAKIISQLPSEQKPDLIMVKADSTRRVMPKNLQAIDCPTVLLCADTHHLEKPIQTLLDYAAAEQFDFYLFSFDRHHAHYFQEAGFNNLFWIPVVHIYPRSPSPRKLHKYPLSFIGQSGKFHPYRKYILDLVRQWQFPLNQQQLPHDKAAEVYADSLINLNISLNGDLNLRTFEVLASGGFLLTDKISPQAGLDLLFEDGKHLVYYTDEADLREKINYFLNHPQAAQAIAANGCKAFWNNHRPEQNVRRLMDYLNGKGIDPIFQIESEPRNVYLTQSEGEAFVTEVMEARKDFGTNALPLHRHDIQKQNALKHRISIYEYLQEMHRTTPKLKGLFWDSIDERIVADAVDLPRLQVHLLQEEGSHHELFDRCQITEQISFITPAQLNGNINPWDLVIINGQELQKIGVEAFLNQLNLKLLIITDIKVNPELEQSLQSAGLVKQSQQPLVYEWSGKSTIDKQTIAAIAQLRYEGCVDSRIRGNDRFDRVPHQNDQGYNTNYNTNIELLINQALTYHQQGQFTQAIPLYQQVLTAEPDNVLVLNNYGKALQKVNRHQEAIDILRRAIKLKPDRAQLYFSLSQSLKVQGDMEAAAQCLQKTIQLQPDFWGAYNNLGTILQQQGNLAEAAQCYAKALEYNHNFAQAHSNLASIWQLQGDLERAKVGLNRALQLEPNYVPALLNLAHLYKQQGDNSEAIAYYQKVLAQEPRPEAYYNLGEICEYQENFVAALECYAKAQQLDPETYNIAGQMNYARLKICDWEDYESRTAELIQSVQKYLNQETAYSPSPLALSSFPVPLTLHRQFAESLSRATVAKMAKIKAGCNFAYPPNPDKLKIGYISPDFREHAVGKILKDMFSYHDRDRFEVYAYSTIDYNDAITESIRNGCDRFIDLSAMTAEMAARQINSDGIHILIDLAGRTIGNGLEILALQPAPIQAQFLGYPDTIGAEFIQYAIADSWLITPEIAETYTEEIIYLPHAFFSSPMEISERMMTRAEFGIPEDAFVFCCFNSHYKITPELFDIWMRILVGTRQCGVPTILWLTGGSETLVANLRREAEKRGIDGNRLFFTEKLPNSEYLARYRLADLFLDTFIYNAGSTAISALWAGVPVLTRPGNTNASRMGASICAAAELKSLICKSSEEYEQQAIYMATHPRSIAYYRRHLAKNRDRLPLFNVAQFVKNLETALGKLVYSVSRTGEIQNLLGFPHSRE